MFNYQGISGPAILEDLESVTSNDFGYTQGKVFNSICTIPNIVAEEVFSKYIGMNHGDLRIFPSIRYFEEKVVSYVAEILTADLARGIVVSGATEANMLALYLAREKAGLKVGRTGNVIVFESRHFSIDKACAILNLELKILPISELNKRGDYSLLKETITENTICVVPTAGTSEFGAVDEINSIAEVAAQKGIFCHVDAASGGFLIPFARKLGYTQLPELSMKNPAISTVAVDPHKYGMAPIPSGILMFNNEADFNRLCFSSFFKCTQDHKTVLGTRPGAAVLATYAAMRNIGYTGYLALTRKYFHLRDYLKGLLADKGVSFFIEPDLNIVTLGHPGVDTFISNMENGGWIISRSKKYDCLRLVIANHHTEQFIRDFANQYINSLQSNASYK
ncbi:MAG: tyrosine decarboxylase MfnA [Ferruginibacter sp.]